MNVPKRLARAEDGVQWRLTRCPKREFDKNNCGLGRETRKRVDHDKRGIIVGL